MTIQELFIRANQALRSAVDRIADDQWSLPMPAGTTIKPATLGEAVRRNSYDDAWVEDTLAGRTIEEVGTRHDDVLVQPDIRATFDDYNERAIEVVRDFTDLDRQVHLSYGDFPARDYLQHITAFRAFRSYDIAKLIGADATMDADFVDALLAEFEPVAEWYRQVGVLPPALPVAADASPQARLLALIGRD